MFQQSYKVIGVMSGTSLDGIDLAVLHFSVTNDKWSFEIGTTETIAYTELWLNKLKEAVNYSSVALQNLNESYTDYLASCIQTFIHKNKITELDAVCSHGHTILHQPEIGVTLQIGNLPKLAVVLNATVVCDFRVQDVSLGGQGAPLVPIGDRFLFSKFDYCLNLGGFSNISFEYEGKRIAFDISAVNTVLNFYANQLGFEYDDQGKIAREGKLIQPLLEKLNGLSYYELPFPKSLGIEYVHGIILPLMESFDNCIEDKMHTYIHHISQQIALALPSKEGKLLITGGGAYNAFLIEQIKLCLPKVEVIIPSKTIIEYKEALIFGFLGVLKLRNELNVLSSVTGAQKDHSSGIIYKGH